MKEKYNLKTIKNILIKEIDEYYKIYNIKKEKNNKIEYLKKIISLFENKKYNILFYNYKKYEEFLQSIDSNISDKQFNNIYFCLCGLVNIYDINEYQDKYEYAINNINTFLNQIKNLLIVKEEEYDSINTNITYQDVSNYKIILSNIRTNTTIDHYGYEDIKKLLIKKGYSEKEIVMFLESVRLHNNYVKLSEKGIKINPSEAYKVLDILNYGYEEINLDKNLSNDKCDNLINSVKQVLKVTTDIKLEEILPTFDNENGFSYGFTMDEFKYVVDSLLLYYQNQLYDEYKNISSLAMYDDKEMRNVIVNSYNEHLTKYIMIRKYYDAEINKYNKYKKEKELEELEESENVLDVYYAVRNNEDSSTFFENDLKDIPYNLYDDVKSLLIRFRKGKLGLAESKTLNEAFRGLKELRDDQIRIMFKHLEGNKYVIVGIFLKKSDNPLNEYSNMYNRQYNGIKNYKECEKSIFDDMDTKKRTGGRKK